MDTSTSTQTINDLFHSAHPEDQALGEKYWDVVNAIVDELAPILRYMTSPRFFSQAKEGCGVTYHCVKVGKNSLGIDVSITSQKGTVATEMVDGEECFRGFYSDTYLLRYIPLEELVSSLQRILHEAIEKRERHLASISAFAEVGRDQGDPESLTPLFHCG